MTSVQHVEAVAGRPGQDRRGGRSGEHSRVPGDLDPVDNALAIGLNETTEQPGIQVDPAVTRSFGGEDDLCLQDARVGDQCPARWCGGCVSHPAECSEVAEMETNIPPQQSHEIIEK